MTTESAFLVEDFLEAITSQLDRTQDALRLKSVNRPLTYAIRDFSLELKVFVEMGGDGQVRFRASGPDEDGASVVQIGFTTVTRPMIDENTVSLSAVRSPTLDELGLGEDERRRLERLGVRNAAQLVRLGKSTGAATVARFAGIPAARLRSALMQGRPAVHGAAPADVPPPEPPMPQPTPQPQPLTPQPAPDAVVAPAVDPVPVKGSPVADARPALPDNVVRLPAGARRLRISGRHLADAVERVHLDGVEVPVAARDDDGVVVDLAGTEGIGTLAVDLGDEGVVTLALSAEDAVAEAASAAAAEPAGVDDDDPWWSA